nr:protein TRACHEARY ELEMENT DIFFERENTIATION-RELATED 7A-like [Lolium perenne]
MRHLRRSWPAAKTEFSPSEEFQDLVPANKDRHKPPPATVEQPPGQPVAADTQRAAHPEANGVPPKITVGAAGTPHRGDADQHRHGARGRTPKSADMNSPHHPKPPPHSQPGPRPWPAPRHPSAMTESPPTPTAAAARMARHAQIGARPSPQPPEAAPPPWPPAGSSAHAAIPVAALAHHHSAETFRSSQEHHVTDAAAARGHHPGNPPHLPRT